MSEFYAFCFVKPDIVGAAGTHRNIDVECIENLSVQNFKLDNAFYKNETLILKASQDSNDVKVYVAIMYAAG